MRTVQRALDILSCFSEERQELTLTDISKEMNLAMSTTTRLLKALEMNHFVEKNQETMKYRLGQRLYLLGYIAGKSIKLRELAKPLMYTLRDETKETVNLYVLDHKSRVCIEQAEGLQSIRHLVKIGEKLPLYAGAGGKVLLAFQSEEFQQQVFASEADHMTMEQWQKNVVIFLKRIPLAVLMNGKSDRRQWRHRSLTFMGRCRHVYPYLDRPNDLLKMSSLNCSKSERACREALRTARLRRQTQF